LGYGFVLLHSFSSLTAYGYLRFSLGSKLRLLVCLFCYSKTLSPLPTSSRPLPSFPLSIHNIPCYLTDTTGTLLMVGSDIDACAYISWCRVVLELGASMVLYMDLSIGKSNKRSPGVFEGYAGVKGAGNYASIALPAVT